MSGHCGMRANVCEHLSPLSHVFHVSVYLSVLEAVLHG